MKRIFGLGTMLCSLYVFAMQITAQDQQTFTLWKTLKAHKDSITSVAFSPDGETVASGSLDHKIILWDAETGEVKQKLSPEEGYLARKILITGWVLYLEYSPGGNILASGYQNGSVRLWDVKTGEEKKLFSKVHKGGCQALAFSPDGKLLASGGVDNTVKLWDVESGELKSTITGHKKQITSVSFTPDGKILASASIDETVRFWDVQAEKSILTITEKSVIQFVVFAKDGKTLAGGSWDNSIKIWNTQTGELKQTMLGKDNVNTLAYSRDGKMLAGGSGKWLQIWDAGTGELKQSVKAHNVSVGGLAFSPDGKMIATGSGNSDFDKTVKLWRIQTEDTTKE